MDARVFNEAGAPDLLFVMGYGDRLDGDSERWFIDRLTGAGYRVHAVQLPVDGASFADAYRAPVQAYHDDHEPAAVVSHSLGGLVAAHLTTTVPQVYLAPWWGFHGEKHLTWERWLVPRLPVRARILSIRTDREELGELVTDEAWERLPKRLSPVFVTEIYRAQRRRPPIDGDATVFVSLRDTVVGLAAIGAAVPPDRIRLYDGGHQLYASACRAEATEAVLSALPS